MYGTLSGIAIAFIATALLVVMVDQMTRIIKEVLPFPQEFEAVINIWSLRNRFGCLLAGDFDLCTILIFPGGTHGVLGIYRLCSWWQLSPG